MPVSDDYILTIPKQELPNLPTERFDADVKVVDSPEDVDSAIDELLHSDVIGFDTETRPSFKRGVVHKVSLVQLSTRKRCFLFRINKTGFMPQLKALLEDESILKIGLSLHDDFHNLNRVAEVNPAGFIDLQTYVKPFHIADISLSRIFAILFGKRISKSQRLTNWEAATLTPQQQTYAALDALACIRIYDYLSSGAFDPSTSSYRQNPEPVAETGS